MLQHEFNFDGDENSVLRNSKCTFGGNSLKINISHPNEEHIKAVEIIIIPYIPKQELGLVIYNKNMTIKKHFENQMLSFEVEVYPEYSYLVSGIYVTDFGNLNSGRNFSSAGEVERLQEKVGCNIKNDFYFKNQHSHNKNFTLQSSLIDCAVACFANSSCLLGWSYQVSTKRCYFLSKGNMTKISLDEHIPETEKQVGWITGLKSCSVPGKFIFYNVKKGFQN